MSDTQNKWVPVSERLPDNGLGRLVLCHGRGIHLGYYDTRSSKWFELPGERILVMATHWMDLPEPPAPPKPVDPFEAWWDTCPKSWPINLRPLAREAWNAAKEHYAKPKDYQRGFEDSVIAFESMVNRIIEGKEDGTGKLEIPELEKLRHVLLERLKPLPDFETWAKAHCADGPYLFIRNKTCLVYRGSAQDIWNAAQGKPEA